MIKRLRRKKVNGVMITFFETTKSCIEKTEL